VSYLDKSTNQKHDLHASRLSVKVIDAVPEPGETPIGLILGIVAGLAIVAALAYFFRQTRKKKEELARQAARVVKPIEEEFLEELKATVDINTLDTKAAFTTLSKILRHYLHQRFAIPAQGIATAEAVEAFRRLNSDINQVTQLEEVLQTSDVAKFSGASGDPGRLARAYALAENFLRANMRPDEMSAAPSK
jgi:hypothetical protein